MMTLSYTKFEINRYLTMGIDRSDVALLVASWGLSAKDLEKANEYLHEWKLQPGKKIKAYNFTGGVEGL